MPKSPDIKTRTFRPTTLEVSEIWDSKDFNAFHGFKGKLVSWFILEITEVIKEHKGKFFTALHNNKVHIKVIYDKED